MAILKAEYYRVLFNITTSRWGIGLSKNYPNNDSQTCHMLIVSSKERPSIVNKLLSFSVFSFVALQKYKIPVAKALQFLLNMQYFGSSD